MRPASAPPIDASGADAGITKIADLCAPVTARAAYNDYNDSATAHSRTRHRRTAAATQ